MQNPRLASRYAKSLLDLAVEQNAVDTTLADLQMLEQLCRQNPDFVNMLRSPIIKADKKQHIIDAVLGSRIQTLTAAFIKLLVNKGREADMPEIATAFINQYKEKNNIQTAKLTTAVPVSDALKETIRTRVLASMPGTTIELKEEVDPELIGGFVLQVGDKLVDASIRRDLHDVKAQFLKNLYVSELR